MSNLPFITSPWGPPDWITLSAAHTLLRKKESALGTPGADKRSQGEGKGALCLKLGHRASSGADGVWNGFARTCAEARVGGRSE